MSQWSRMIPVLVLLAGPSAASGQVSVRPEPALEIGGIFEAGDEALHQVVDVLPLPDGSIAIGNAGTHEILIYTPVGEYLRSLGGEGEGPGEFSRLQSLGLASSDSLVAFDRGQQRITLFSPLGDVGRDFRTTALSAGRVVEKAVFLENGRWVSVETGLEGVGDKEGLRAAQISLVVRDELGEALQELGRGLQGEVWATASIRGQMGSRHALFSPRPSYDSFGDCVVFSSGGSTVEVFSQSGRESFQLERPRRPVTQELVSRWIEHTYEDVPPAEREQVRRTLTSFPRPDSLPLVHQMVTDSRGFIWIQFYEPPVGLSSSWVVVDAGGAEVAEIDLPVPLEVHDVGVDSIVGIRRGEFDEEILSVYPLIWDTDGSERTLRDACVAPG